MINECNKWPIRINYQNTYILLNKTIITTNNVNSTVVIKFMYRYTV